MKTLLAILTIGIFVSNFAFSNEVKDFRFYCKNIESIPVSQQLIPRALSLLNRKLNCEEIFQKYQTDSIQLDLPFHLTLFDQQAISFAPLRGFPLIQLLSARNYKIEDASALASIYNIITLDLEGSTINGEILDIAGGNLNYIGLLNLNNTNIKTLDNIPEIDIFDLFISNTGINNLNFLTTRKNMGSLLAANNGIVDVSPLSLFNNLSDLDLSGNKITDISAINTKHISSLDLSNNPLGDEGVKNLTLWVLVHHLSLENTGITNVDFLRPQQTELGDWGSVNLSNNPIIDLSGLSGHTSPFGEPTIEYLNISSTLVNKDDVPQDLFVLRLTSN